MLRKTCVSCIKNPQTDLPPKLTVNNLAAAEFFPADFQQRYFSDGGGQIRRLTGLLTNNSPLIYIHIHRSYYHIPLYQCLVIRLMVTFSAHAPALDRLHDKTALNLEIMWK
jgi:hypothetical protein